MNIQYTNLKMRAKNREKLTKINLIIEDFQAQGYVLTLRQLYYQLVQSNTIPNKVTEYKKLSTLLKEGRMAGVVDWSAIEDRLRVPSIPYSYLSPQQAVDDAIRTYRLDRQKGQENYIEVWVEKDALSGILERVTQPYHVRILVCRGYSSASAMHNAYQRFKNANAEGKAVKLLYLGDFDPSGEDMVRDIGDRMEEFADGEFYPLNFSIEKIGLTKPQIKLYKPPPNPTKETDPRAQDFISLHGNRSWEVDALSPKVLNATLENRIKELIDVPSYKAIIKQEEADKEELRELSKKMGKKK